MFLLNELQILQRRGYYCLWCVANHEAVNNGINTLLLSIWVRARNGVNTWWNLFVPRKYEKFLYEKIKQRKL